MGVTSISNCYDSTLLRRFASLENTMIVAAFPFSIIMILMVLSLFKALKNEKRKRTSS